MNDSERDVLRTLIREEVRAALDEHEANLAVARVRRSAALEELARLDGCLVDRSPGGVTWLPDGVKPSQWRI